MEEATENSKYKEFINFLGYGRDIVFERFYFADILLSCVIPACRESFLKKILDKPE